MLGALCAGAATHYVDAQNGAGAAVPFTNWATAAVRIQDAVDVASAGAFILVNTGVYASGVQFTPGFALANRLVVTNALTIASVGGPAVTAIAGTRDASSLLGLGSNAVRGVYLAGGAFLTGFSISNGATFGVGTNTGHSFLERSGGGVFLDNAGISNCIIANNAADYYGGGVCGSNGVVVCAAQISSNWAHASGGGIAWATNTVLLDSRISDNIVADDGIGLSTDGGGGVCASASGLISNCVISGNLCLRGGGGGVLIWRGMVEIIDCTIRGNRCTVGRAGGIYVNSWWPYYRVVVNNCSIEDNANGPSQYGGGAYIYCGEVNNCLIAGNLAQGSGGGVMAASCWLNNCTIVSNRSQTSAGGVYLSDTKTVLRNSIVYDNSAPAPHTNFYVSSGAITCAFVCTMPLILGEGNSTNDPQFADFDGGNYRLALGSPCINAGSNAYAVGAFDLDDTARIKQSIVDMGAYEAVPEPVTPCMVLLFTIYKLRVESRQRRERYTIKC